MWQKAQVAAQLYLEERAKPLLERGLQVTTSLVYGHPAEILASYSAGVAEPDNLIALSTHGRSGLARFFLGSVTDRLLQTARMPLLIVHPEDGIGEPVANLTNLIVPLDGSELAEAILPLVSELARTLTLHVNLVQVIPLGSILYGGAESIYPANLLQELETSAEAYLERVAERLRAEGVTVDRDVLLHHDAGTSITELAMQQGEALIAMSTHGRSGFNRWLLGSVTNQVVRTSGSPVLVVRPRESSDHD
jgi:nucleotide-binding universal stress UspA family protein